MEFEINSYYPLLTQLYANEQGFGQSFSKAAYEAFYEDTLNIGKKEVILDIAKDVGLDPIEVEDVLNSKKNHDALVSNMDNARNLGFKKFPTFVINDDHVIIGSPNEKKLKALFESLI